MPEYRQPWSSMRVAGDLRIDLEGYQIVACGTTLELTRLQHDLLAALSSHVGELVTHEQLAAAGWGDDGDRRVEIRNAIYKLRSMICRGDRAPAIETVAGHGYILAVPPTSVSTSDRAREESPGRNESGEELLKGSSKRATARQGVC